MTNQLPQNLSAEESILCTVMARPESAAEAVAELSPEHFFGPRNREVFVAICALFAAGEPCDLVGVAGKISANPKAQVRMEQVSELADGIPFPDGIKHRARMVRDAHKARQVIELAGSIQAQCFTGAPVKSVIDNFGAGFRAVMADKSTEAPTAGKLAEDVYQQVVDAHQHGRQSGIPTGFIDIDRRIIGMERKDLLILAARPSMGKTALAMNIAANVAETGRKVLVFSLEMGGESISRRQISAYAGISVQDLRSGNVPDDKWSSITRAVGKLGTLPMVIDDAAGLSIQELQARAAMEAIKGPVDLIVVDYLQLLRAKAENKTQEVAAISCGLKQMAKSLDVPVLALSQLNRGLESRTDKRPMMSDLRESGAIEQDADVIMFIYRDDVYNRDEFSPHRGTAEIITAKQRNGPTGIDRLLFQGEYSRFLNLEGTR